MKIPSKSIQPDYEAFGRDPLGYGALAWHKWGLVQTLAGFPVDLAKGPTSEDLKSPVLWLSHAHAMSEAARILIQNSPKVELMPKEIWGICHCQYHSIALMLVGYSLEICLKAMLIMHKGVAAYQAEERKHFNHDLQSLADFVPNLTDKDKATLRALTHYVKWAGRYPDPGFGNLNKANDIFNIAEQHEVTAHDLFAMSARIMKHVKTMV